MTGFKNKRSVFMRINLPRTEESFLKLAYWTRGWLLLCRAGGGGKECQLPGYGFTLHHQKGNELVIDFM